MLILFMILWSIMKLQGLGKRLDRLIGIVLSLLSLESNEFTAAVLDDGELPFKLSGAVKALTIGGYLQESLRTGNKLFFDEIGERVAGPTGAKL